MLDTPSDLKVTVARLSPIYSRSEQPLEPTLANRATNRCRAEGCSSPAAPLAGPLHARCARASPRHLGCCVPILHPLARACTFSVPESHPRTRRQTRSASWRRSVSAAADRSSTRCGAAGCLCLRLITPTAAEWRRHSNERKDAALLGGVMQSCSFSV